jgi:hypothetical protein
VSEYHRRVLRTTGTLLFIACVALVPGCRGVRPITEGPGYPAAMPLGDTLDIQLARDGTEVELTNTTPRAFGESTIWLNRWYGRRIGGLAPGQTLRLGLRDFKDMYGESFRAGGFFAIQRADRVAVAELDTGGGRLLPLVVVGERER